MWIINRITGLHKNIRFQDPEMRSWFLVRNNYLPFILIGCYVLFSTIVGPAFMKNRKPFDLRKTMVFFNLLLVSIYGTFLLVTVFSMPYVTKEQFCYGVKVKRGEVTYIVARIGWLIYIVKYLEFFDTVFFILRKKENLVSFLHVSHHTVVPIFGWLIMRTENSGLQIVPAAINALVHFIMYSYYGLAAMGPKVRKYLWWKKYLTQLQMAQMIVVTIFITIFAPLTGCKMVLSSYLIDSVIFPFYFYLFYRFYKTRFMTKSKSPKENIHPGKSMTEKEQNNEEYMYQAIRNGMWKKQE